MPHRFHAPSQDCDILKLAKRLRVLSLEAEELDLTISEAEQRGDRNGADLAEMERLRGTKSANRAEMAAVEELIVSTEAGTLAEAAIHLLLASSYTRFLRANADGHAADLLDKVGRLISSILEAIVHEIEGGLDELAVSAS